MHEPREWSIREAGERMRDGELTAERLMESCLERIHAREGIIHAWVGVYEKEALAEARRCDREMRRGCPRGPLHGIPVGVKDIIDVQGQYTRCGTPAYPARIPDEDAPAIARLRKAGAIFLGKTETTPFANNDPTITRNPWNPEHTPGGSSSGSGAAVADGMCLLALGTQTGGSLLRPAAYNGIVGFKATYGEVSTEGVLPNSWSLDHVGFHVRSAGDAAVVWPCLREEEPRPFARMPEPALMSHVWLPGSAPRLGYIREFFEGEASPEVLANLAAVRERFRAAGAEVVEISLPPLLPLWAPAGASSSRPSSTPITGSSSRRAATNTRRSSRSAWRRETPSPAMSTSNTSATGSPARGRCAHKWPTWTP